MTEPDMEGVDISQTSRAYLKTGWSGESFLAIGMQDPVLGPNIMEDLRANINGCPEPMRLQEAGHFVPEWGKEIAETALLHWGLKI